MEPVDLVTWCTSLRTISRDFEKFDKLAGEAQTQILKCESNPYEVIGALEVKRVILCCTTSK